MFKRVTLRRQEWDLSDVMRVTRMDWRRNGQSLSVVKGIPRTKAYIQSFTSTQVGTQVPRYLQYRADFPHLVTKSITKAEGTAIFNIFMAL